MIQLDTSGCSFRTAYYDPTSQTITVRELDFSEKEMSVIQIKEIANSPPYSFNYQMVKEARHLLSQITPVRNETPRSKTLLLL